MTAADTRGPAGPPAATTGLSPVPLCDADHGLAHDLDLIMTRRAGEPIVTTHDGHRVWGAADAAYPGGLAGPARPDRAADEFAGVHPLDTRTGRRPTDAPPIDTGDRQGTIAPRPPARRRTVGQPPHPTRPPRRPTTTGRRTGGTPARPAGPPPAGPPSPPHHPHRRASPSG